MRALQSSSLKSPFNCRRKNMDAIRLYHIKKVQLFLLLLQSAIPSTTPLGCSEVDPFFGPPLSPAPCGGAKCSDTARVVRFHDLVPSFGEATNGSLNKSGIWRYLGPENPHVLSSCSIVNGHLWGMSCCKCYINPAIFRVGDGYGTMAHRRDGR